MEAARPEPMIVSEARARELVRPRDAAAAAVIAFEALGTPGRVLQPAAQSYDFESEQGELHVKGAHIAGLPVFCVKMASGFYRNVERGLGPSSAGQVTLFSASSGYPLAIVLDNSYLTDQRTAAAAALASRLLLLRGADAAPPERRGGAAVGVTMAVIGAGAIARLVVEHVALVRLSSLLLCCDGVVVVVMLLQWVCVVGAVLLCFRPAQPSARCDATHRTAVE